MGILDRIQKSTFHEKTSSDLKLFLLLNFCNPFNFLILFIYAFIFSKPDRDIPEKGDMSLQETSTRLRKLLNRKTFEFN